jgi:hypothetical protein
MHYAAWNCDDRIQTKCLASLRPHAHEGLPSTLRDELVVLIIGTMVELDDAGAGPRLRFPLAHDLSAAMHRVVLEERMREFHFGHSKIGDGRPDGKVGDRDADHQPEREQRIHQGLAPFGLVLTEMPIDVERLRVECHVGEQHVVHLSHRARVPVLEQFADREVFEVESSALVTNRRCLRHDSLPSLCFVQP